MRQLINPEYQTPNRRRGLLGRIIWWFRREIRRLRMRLPAHVPIAYKLTLVFSLLIAGGMAILGGLLVNNQTQVLDEQIGTFGETLVQRAADSAVEPLLASSWSERSWMRSESKLSPAEGPFPGRSFG